MDRTFAFLKKLISTIVIITILFSALSIGNLMAEETEPDFTSLTLKQLNEFLDDINREIQINHVITDDMKQSVLAAVKTETEEYYANQGIDISWAWYDREYEYTKAWDTYSLRTHIDYKDINNRNQQRNIYAQVFFKGEEADVFFLDADGEIFIDKRDDYTNKLWNKEPEGITNKATGYNLATVSEKKLNEMKKRIGEEIEKNHKTSERVRNLLLLLAKAEVEQYYIDQDVTVDWPWSENNYEYVRDWDYYTLSTTIEIKANNAKNNKVKVYAEVIKNNDRYELCYETIDEIVLINRKESISSLTEREQILETTTKPTNKPSPTKTEGKTTETALKPTPKKKANKPTATPKKKKSKATAKPTATPKKAKKSQTEIYALRAAVVAITNSQATDVYKADGFTLDPSKFHKYSDTADYYMTVYEEGTWTKKKNNNWQVKDMILQIIPYGTYLRASFDITYKSEKFTIKNLKKVIASLEYIHTEDPQYTTVIKETNGEKFLTVSLNFVKKDRAKEKTVTSTPKPTAAPSKDWVGSEYNPFDGSNRSFNKLIKAHLNDEESFKHIDTTITEVTDDYLKTYVNSILQIAGYSYRVDIGDVFLITEFSENNEYNATIKAKAYGLAFYKANKLILLSIEE